MSEDQANINSESKKQNQNDVLYGDFQKKFPKDKLRELTLEEYTNLKENDDDYFCRWVEQKLKSLGEIRGSNSLKFGIYRYNEFPKIKCQHDEMYAWRDDFGDNAKDAFEKIKQKLIEVVEAASQKDCVNYESIEKNPLSEMFKWKIAFLYSDRRLVPIYSKKMLLDILKKCDISIPQGKTVAEIQKLLIEKKPSDEDIWKYTDSIWEKYYSEFPTKESPNVIFYGAPGTGKTYKVNEYLRTKYPDEKSFEEHVSWVQFHPNYSYEDFIEGIKPLGIDKKTNSIKLELVNGHFKDICIKAKHNPNNEYYFVADEINRANLSAVFGETLSLIEASYRDDPNGERHLLKKQYSEVEKNIHSEKSAEQSNSYNVKCYESDGRFGVPQNIRFIGMMNDVDKSIDAFDLALRRRFKWIRTDCNYGVIQDECDNGDSILEGGDDFIIACARLNYFISGIIPSADTQGIDEEKIKKVKDFIKKEDCLSLGSSYEFGHSIYMKIRNVCESKQSKKIRNEDKTDLFDQYLLPTLKEYLRSYFPEEDLGIKIDDAKTIFLGTKKKKNNPNSSATEDLTDGQPE